jgi:hypothetical protein
MVRLKKGESEEYLKVQAQLIGLDKNLIAEEPFSVTYGIAKEPRVHWQTRSINPRDPFSKHQRIPQWTEYIPKYDIEFTKEQADYWFKYRANDSISLTVTREGQGRVYAVDSYKRWRDEPFEQLWEDVSSPPKQKVDLDIKGIKERIESEEQEERKAYQQAVKREKEPRRVI